MRRIGVTTTIPSEVLLSANCEIVDLNNEFITNENYSALIDMAEKDGFPKSSCAWIKGIYGACIDNHIKEVVGVMEGDCSNTKALVEVFQQRGIKIYPFSYPTDRKLNMVKKEIDKLIKLFQVDIDTVEKYRLRLNGIRALANNIDKLTYIDNKASGFENHLYQISCSDFNKDHKKYKTELENKIKEIKHREPFNQKLRLAYIGVPPMTGDLYDYVESLDARIVYNEVQREFAFPRADSANNIYEQYLDYTYPYDVWFRLKVIKEQIKNRSIDAVIHYTQAFCHKAIEHIIISKEIDIPVLNIEGDKSNVLDARTKLRLEAFLDMLSDMKGVRG
ncbi:2-hydroxyglutaryl-CoA dehydratase [Vallitalea longa]|uniref:2-hydroxyglutaryl-CoA dehydratase n=1 Tax=Vallitalea longa TaxID=2936439 RepID=A0A9W5YBD0_9FIRM|nr:2-hydroxyacyl-CoA dehydratase [Vallitalea longa]GKX28839.1 2-hydroxyglutaryl-CoA dehydratase [Vallitalea longa]